MALGLTMALWPADLLAAQHTTGGQAGVLSQADVAQTSGHCGAGKAHCNFS
jgi:hypothetical protein